MANSLEYMRHWRAKNATKMRAYRRKWEQENREQVLECKRNWNRRNPRPPRNREKDVTGALRRLYGITYEHFVSMRFVQKDKCAVCKKRFGEGKYDGPCVEHCHRTGKVRGLCCRRCNAMLGALESPLRPALEEYLRKHA